MTTPSDPLVTPIHLKTREQIAWPAGESAFYLLAGNGLFLCRDHEFFRSCVPAPTWPSELASHAAELRLSYPKIPQTMLESIVGFFDRIAELHGSEAGVLLAWNRTARQIELIVPAQDATVGRSYGGSVYPIGLHYEVPHDLPADWTIIGDVHSHVDGAAYASGTDKTDERHRAGLHIVVGRLYREPPELHIEAVVDGWRFRVEPGQVIAGYKTRNTNVPQEWIARVTVCPAKSNGSYHRTNGSQHSGHGGSTAPWPGKRFGGESTFGSNRLGDPNGGPTE